jgi:hypothetical protein
MSVGRKSGSIPDLNEFEKLLVNNPDLHRIKAHLGRFNPIKVMGMESMEIRHSFILRWLLDPQESHGLGDDFLKAFLAEAMSRCDGGSPPSALDILKSDLTDADVRREWRNIDLLMLSPRNGWVFVIENKFHGSQHSNQLNRYMADATTTFVTNGPFESIRGIFLTLWDEDPENERYAPVGYEAVSRLLEQVSESRPHPLAPEVAAFITHYLQIIREATYMDEEFKKVEKLARELYREHKNVLDFIVENGETTGFEFAVETVFGEKLEWEDAICDIDGATFFCRGLGSNIVSVLPKSWFDGFGGYKHCWRGCEDHWHGFPLIAWIQIMTSTDGTDDKIRLYAEVGPLSDHAFRVDLIEAIQGCTEENESLRIKFQHGATNEMRRSSKFLKKNTFPVDDVHDHEKIAIVIKKALKAFRPEFEAVAKVIPQFERHGKPKKSQ